MREKTTEEIMDEIRAQALAAKRKAYYVRFLATSIDALNDDHLDSFIREARALSDLAEGLEALALEVMYPTPDSYHYRSVTQ